MKGWYVNSVLESRTKILKSINIECEIFFMNRDPISGWCGCHFHHSYGLDYSYGRPPAMLASGYSVLPLSFSSFYFRRLISEVAWPIVTKLCHMFDGEPGL